MLNMLSCCRFHLIMVKVVHGENQIIVYYVLHFVERLHAAALESETSFLSCPHDPSIVQGWSTCGPYGS